MQLSAPFPRNQRFLGLPGSFRPNPIVALGVVVVLVGAAAFAFSRLTATPAVGPTLQTFTVRPATVSNTVNATGTVVSSHLAKLVFPTTGRVAQIDVAVGDTVKAGQVLAQLDTTSLQLKLQQAQSQLTTAQLRLQQLTEAASPEEIAAAQAALDAAVAKQDLLLAGPTQTDLNSAQAAVAQAQSSYTAALAKLNTLQAGPTSSERADVDAAVLSAQNTLANAQAKLKLLQAGATEADLIAAKAAVDSATGQLASAQAKLDQLKAGPTEADLVAAQTAVDQAMANLQNADAKRQQVAAQAQVPVDLLGAQGDLLKAQQAVTAAERGVADLTFDLEQARATLDEQVNALEVSKRNSENVCRESGESSTECGQAKNAVDRIYPNLAGAQQAVERLTPPSGSAVIAAQDALTGAKAGLASAEARLQQLKAGQSIPTEIIAAETGYVGAQAGLKNAQAKLAALKEGPTPADLLAAQIAVQGAQGSLASAQAKLDQVNQGATEADRIAAEGAVSSAEAQLASAMAKQAALGTVAPEDMQSAQSGLESAQLNLQSAQQKLEELKAGPADADTASATSAVAQAASSLSKLQGGSAKATDLALQQESLKQAQMAVQQAQADLDGAILTAPFDGIVGMISSNVGEMAATGANGFVLLVDPTQMRVDVTVDETDVVKIQAGKPATITFDALTGRSYTGTVLSVSPTGTLTQGVVTYPVSVSIDLRGQGPTSGMTATTNIVIDQKENVLAVPPRAVQRQGRDQVVNVLGGDGTPVQRVVRTGISSDSLVEIVEGVQEGDQVVIPGTTTRAPNVGSGGIPGAGGGAVSKQPVIITR